jgi:hypothetical protein
MSYDHHINNPTGRVYRNRRTRMAWSVELEIGGAVWLRSDAGQLITARVDSLSGSEWERIA